MRAHMESFNPNCRITVIRSDGSRPEKAPKKEDVDFVEMAKNFQHYLKNNPVPSKGHQVRFSLWGLHMPVFYPWPYLTSGRPLPDMGIIDPIVLGDTDSRMGYAFPYMREIGGTNEELSEVEQILHDRLIGYMGDDGISCTYHPFASNLQLAEKGEEYGSLWATAKALLMECENYVLSGRKENLSLAKKAYNGIKLMADWNEGRAYIENGLWKDGGWAQMQKDYWTYVLDPVVRYYEVTQDPEVLSFACALAQGMLDEILPSLGTAAIANDGSYNSHSHVNMHALSGMAHLGAITNDPRYIVWIRKIYENMRSRGADFGWFPEGNPKNPNDAAHMGHTEICLVADMIHIAVWLGEAGLSEYFDHAERYMRNMIKNAQFFVTPEFIELYKKTHCGKNPEDIEREINELKHIEGGFASCPTLNDLVDDDIIHHGTAGNPPLLLDMMGCCPPEGMRAAWTVWKHIVTVKNDGLYVNMSLPCETTDVKIQTRLPMEGQVDIMPKHGGDVFFRPPKWTPRRKVEVYIDGKSSKIEWDREYIHFKDIKSGNTVTVRYPLPEFKQVIYPMAGKNTRDYTVYWLGNTVLKIEPQGKYLPLFKD